MSAYPRITPDDRLMIDGCAYRLHSRESGILTFEALEGGGSLSFGFDEFSALLKQPGVVLECGFYLPERSRSRKQSGFEKIGDLPEQMRSEVLWKLSYCMAFLQFEQEGRARRTDAAIREALPALRQQVERLDLASRFKWKTPRAGTLIYTRQPPSARSLRRWLKCYERASASALALVPRYHRSGNRGHRFGRQERKLIDSVLEEYLTQDRKTKKMVFDICQARFAQENETRAHEGRPLLRAPSRRTIERMLSDQDPYFQMIHRRGVAETNRRYRVWENGLEASYPLERVEIDEWKVDLISILADGDVLDGLSPEELARLERGRRWLYLAIDCATRCVVAMRLAAEPNASDAIALLADITRDKSDLAGAAQCRGNWREYGGLVSVVTDQGAAFVDEGFRTAILDAGGHHEIPPGGLPHLRGCVERIFRSLGSELMPQLGGRTFSGPKERGDYPSEELASLSDEALMQILILHIVDVYHNRPHGGLDGETPRARWKRLVGERGIAPGLSEQTRKIAFGWRSRRKVTGKGVRLNGIDYTCKLLRHIHLHRHEAEIEVSFDPLDLGWIVVRIDGKWHPATAVQGCFEGVSLDAWRAAAHDLRLRHRGEAALEETTVRRALEKIAEIRKREEERFGVSLSRLPPSQARRARDDLFMGLSIAVDEAADSSLPPERDLFSGIIPKAEPEACPDTGGGDAMPSDSREDRGGNEGFPGWEFDDD